MGFQHDTKADVYELRDFDMIPRNAWELRDFDMIPSNRGMPMSYGIST